MTQPLTNEGVTDFSQCPVDDKQRQRTDVFCTVCTGVFAAILFIISCACFDNGNLQKMTYLTDSDGVVCASERAGTFPIVYFSSPNDPRKRLCVSQCPKAGQTKLKCSPNSKVSCSANDNPKFEVQIYDSKVVVNRISLFCAPTNPQVYDKVVDSSGIRGKYSFLQIYDSVWTSLWISILFGIILLVAIQFFPRQIVNWMYILGAASFLAIAFVIFIVPDGFILFKIIAGVLFLLMGGIVFMSIIKKEFRREIFICGRLLQISATIVKQNLLILVYILVWWVFQVGLIALSIFQLLAVWSIGPLTFNQQNSFWEVGSFISNLLSFFVFLQFIWGLSFLKQSFNFCVGGFATSWYCYSAKDKSKLSLLESPKRLICYHWGSVAGGSLLLWLFYFIDLFVDFFFGNEEAVEGINPPVFQKKTSTRTFSSIFDLIRSESFAYINLIPIPYCNASRYCEMMAEDSQFYDRSQTTNRLYRLCAHIVIIMIATLIALAANQHTDSTPNVVGVIFVAIVSLFSVTYFIGLHGDLAEGVLVSVFIEEKLNSFKNIHPETTTVNYDTIKVAPEAVKQLYYDDVQGSNIYNESTLLDFVKGSVAGK